MIRVLSIIIATTLLTQNSYARFSCKDLVSKIQTKTRDIKFKLQKSVKRTRSVFKSESTKYILLETEEGRKILSKTLRRDFESMTSDSYYLYRLFLHKSKSYNKSEMYAQIHKRLKIANDLIGDIDNGQVLSEEQKELLDLFSKELLQIDDSGKSFFKPIEKETKEILEARSSKIENSYLVGEKISRFRTIGLLKDMKSCLRSMPAKEKSKRTLELALTQLGIAEFWTVFGYTSAAYAGDRDVDWGNLPTDMVVAAASNLIEPYLALSGASFAGRYAKLLLWGGAKSGGEGLIYYYSPLTETHGHDKADIAMARTQYSFAWAAGNSVVKIGFYGAMLGLQCLYPNYLVKFSTNFGLSIGYRAGSSYLYFLVRNNVMDDMGLGDSVE